MQFRQPTGKRHPARSASEAVASFTRAHRRKRSMGAAPCASRRPYVAFGPYRRLWCFFLFLIGPSSFRQIEAKQKHDGRGRPDDAFEPRSRASLSPSIDLCVSPVIRSRARHAWPVALSLHLFSELSLPPCALYFAVVWGSPAGGRAGDASGAHRRRAAGAMAACAPSGSRYCSAPGYSRAPLHRPIHPSRSFARGACDFFSVSFFSFVGIVGFCPCGF